MTESDLKRALVKSIRAQGGVGHRFEDKYSIGWPDLLLIPERGPVFFAEVKLIKIVREPRMMCTPTQAVQLARLSRDSYKGRHFCHGVLIAYCPTRLALYIGQPDMLLTHCRFVPRPSKLDSAEWWITELLYKYDAGASHLHPYNPKDEETADEFPC